LLGLIWITTLEGPALALALVSQALRLGIFELTWTSLGSAVDLPTTFLVAFFIGVGVVKGTGMGL